MSLEDTLKGKFVVVEAQIYGGSLSNNSQLYVGTYDGNDTFADETVVVLTNAHYWNKAAVLWPEREESQRNRVCASPLAIPTKFLLSIGLWDEGAHKKLDEENRKGK